MEYDVICSSLPEKKFLAMENKEEAKVMNATYPQSVNCTQNKPIFINSSNERIYSRILKQLFIFSSLAVIYSFSLGRITTEFKKKEEVPQILDCLRY